MHGKWGTTRSQELLCTTVNTPQWPWMCPPGRQQQGTLDVPSRQTETRYLRLSLTLVFYKGPWLLGTTARHCWALQQGTAVLLCSLHVVTRRQQKSHFWPHHRYTRGAYLCCLWNLLTFQHDLNWSLAAVNLGVIQPLHGHLIFFFFFFFVCFWFCRCNNGRKWGCSRVNQKFVYLGNRRTRYIQTRSALSWSGKSRKLFNFFPYLIIDIKIMWHDQGEWVTCRQSSILSFQH